MEFYDKYMAKLDAEGNDPELLEELRREAIQSLQADSPERALTVTGQMVAALLFAAKHQEPPEQSMVDAINGLTTMMVDYIERLGWRQWAVKTEAGWVYKQLSPSS